MRNGPEPCKPKPRKISEEEKALFKKFREIAKLGYDEKDIYNRLCERAKNEGGISLPEYQRFRLLGYEFPSYDWIYQIRIRCYYEDKLHQEDGIFWGIIGTQIPAILESLNINHPFKHHSFIPVLQYHIELPYEWAT